MLGKKLSNNPLLSDVYEERSRHRRRALLGIFLFFFAAILLGGVWAVFRSSLFRIREISVSGNTMIASEDVITLFQNAIAKSSWLKRMLGPRNILSWPSPFGVPPKGLGWPPRVKQVAVKKNYRSRTVAISVVERTPFGVWCHKPQTNADLTQTHADTEAKITPESTSTQIENLPRKSAECWWFDSDGVMFEPATEIEGSLIPAVSDYSGRDIGLYAKILPDGFISNIISIFRVLSSSGLAVREVRLENLDLQEIKVLTYEGLPAIASATVEAKAGPELYFSLRFPADDAAAVLASLAGKGDLNKLQYVDFRAENRAYYR